MSDRAVLEADSFEWHGSRAAQMRALGTTTLRSAGLHVPRFTWEDVMFDATWVRSISTRP